MAVHIMLEMAMAAADERVYASKVEPLLACLSRDDSIELACLHGLQYRYVMTHTCARSRWKRPDPLLLKN